MTWTVLFYLISHKLTGKHYAKLVPEFHRYGFRTNYPDVVIPIKFDEFQQPYYQFGRGCNGRSYEKDICN